MFIRPLASSQHLLLNLGKKTRLYHNFNNSRRNEILNNIMKRTFKSSTAHMEHPHDMRKKWILEKAVSGLMVPLVPIALAMPNKILDSILAILITSHAFWGMEAMVVEYVRVILVGHLLPKICMLGVYGTTLLLMGGLYYLIFNDIGLTSSFWKIWRNMAKTK